MDRNLLIGNNNKLPWHLPADFAWFKRVTMGKPIIMGRKTFESIGRPLPGRANIIISRDPDLDIDGTCCVNSLQAACELEPESAEQMIIGGSSIYELAMPLVQRMYLTHVDAEFEGDAWFPEIADDWQKVSSERHEVDDKNSWGCEFAVYERQDEKM